MGPSASLSFAWRLTGPERPILRTQLTWLAQLNCQRTDYSVRICCGAPEFGVSRPGRRLYVGRLPGGSDAPRAIFYNTRVQACCQQVSRKKIGSVPGLPSAGALLIALGFCANPEVRAAGWAPSKALGFASSPLEIAGLHCAPAAKVRTGGIGPVFRPKSQETAEARSLFRA
jgi:hypothetical protein